MAASAARVTIGDEGAGRYRTTYVALAVLLFAALVASAGVGAFSFSPATMARYFAQGLGWSSPNDADILARNVFLQLRLPRVLVGALTGAVLGVSGALMQGLFRNPIVEPGLAGTSAGAALGASLVFVLGGGTALAFTRPLGTLAVPVLANRGQWLPRPDGRQVLVTVHPSSLLRASSSQDREAAYAAGVARKPRI